MSKIYPYTGNAYIIGVTGPRGRKVPHRQIGEIRRNSLSVAIIAVDPTVPLPEELF